MQFALQTENIYTNQAQCHFSADSFLWPRLGHHVHHVLLIRSESTALPTLTFTSREIRLFLTACKNIKESADIQKTSTWFCPRKAHQDVHIPEPLGKLLLLENRIVTTSSRGQPVHALDPKYLLHKQIQKERTSSSWSPALQLFQSWLEPGIYSQ